MDGDKGRCGVLRARQPVILERSPASLFSLLWEAEPVMITARSRNLENSRTEGKVGTLTAGPGAAGG